MRNLGAAIAGGGGTRRKDDFYPTPPEAVSALLDSQWAPPHGPLTWEPACGDGAISRVLLARTFRVISTDLVDRGYGTGGVDFLATEKREGVQGITNPPFALAEKFIRHGFVLGLRYQAHLLKAQFWNAASRLALFREHRPAAVLPLTWRLDFTGGGSPTMDCSWVVWDVTASNENTAFEPLSKPLSFEDMLG